MRPVVPSHPTRTDLGAEAEPAWGNYHSPEKCVGHVPGNRCSESIKAQLDGCQPGLNNGNGGQGSERTMAEKARVLEVESSENGAWDLEPWGEPVRPLRHAASTWIKGQRRTNETAGHGQGNQVSTEGEFPVNTSTENQGNLRYLDTRICAFMADMDSSMEYYSLKDQQRLNPGRNS